MSDPEYTYERGKGWVVRNAPQSLYEFVDLRTHGGAFIYEYQHMHPNTNPLWNCIRSCGLYLKYDTLEEAVRTANNDEVAKDAIPHGWIYRIAMVNT